MEDDGERAHDHGNAACTRGPPQDAGPLRQGSPHRVTDQGPPQNLSPRSAAILRAVIDALRPRGHGFDQAIDEYVLLEIDRTLPCLPLLTRLSLPVGLRLLEWGPPLFSRRRRRFTALDRQEARTYLQGWLDSRLAPRRFLVFGLR